jgi:hypothetical protein
MTYGQFGEVLVASMLCYNIGAGLVRWVSGRSVYLFAGVAASLLLAFMWFAGLSANLNAHVNGSVASAAIVGCAVSGFYLGFWLNRAIHHHARRGL